MPVGSRFSFFLLFLFCMYAYGIARIDSLVDALARPKCFAISPFGANMWTGVRPPIRDEL